MVNFELLNKKIKNSGMTVVAVAEKSGILRATLYNKLNGSSDFKASEILKLSSALGLSVDERNNIFFAQECELNSTKRNETVKEVV